MLSLQEFRRRLQGFVAAYDRASSQERITMVDAALVEGLPNVPEPLPQVDDLMRLSADVAVIQASGLFDEVGYMWHNPDLFWDLCGKAEEVWHFAERGWRELRHPQPGFDLWFYWDAFLDPTRDDVNPVVHFALEGRRAGLPTLPEVRALPEPLAPDPDRPARRVCLFAAFDVDGVVDDTVVDYLAELSRFADIYYLADCVMEDGELEKLAPYTHGAWAIRHGRYDFGSYSILATDLVGWEVIDGYDEMMLANDSCWLVQSLDRVFAKMDATTCDWWGLQATYEDFGVEDYERLGRPLSLEDVEEEMRQLDLWRYSDFIHVGSYFLVYRRRVLDDPEFRRRMSSVAAQRDKTAIILKYEIGFSRLLILGGYHLATFVDGILPYHPIYRASAFDLMADGFPILKRQFLHENPFSAPDLRLWKERVLEVAPEADVDSMERNLRRIAPVWSLHRSFAIRSRTNGTAGLPLPLGPDTFADEDRWVPSFDHWWGFPADPRTGLLSGSVRAVFDTVREDPTVKKIILEGDFMLSIDGTNVVRVPTESTGGQMCALRLGTIFTSVGPRSDVNHPLSARHHRFVQLGRPTGLVDPAVPLHGSGDRWGLRDPKATDLDNDFTRIFVASRDEVDVHGIGGRRGLDRDGVWAIGSPRIDLLVCEEPRLASAHHQELDRLRELLNGRRLVVVEPWVSHIDLEQLARWAQGRPDLVVSVRRAYRDPTAVPVPLLDLADEALPQISETAPVPFTPENCWRVAEVLASGSPADLADWSVLARPAVNLTTGNDVPLPVVAGDGLVKALEAALLAEPDVDYLAWGRRLHVLSDGHSAARVVRAVKQTYLPLDEWSAEIEAELGA